MLWTSLREHALAIAKRPRDGDGLFVLQQARTDHHRDQSWKGGGKEQKKAERSERKRTCEKKKTQKRRIGVPLPFFLFWKLRTASVERLSYGRPKANRRQCAPGAVQVTLPCDLRPTIRKIPCIPVDGMGARDSRVRNWLRVRPVLVLASDQNRRSQ